MDSMELSSVYYGLHELPTVLNMLANNVHDWACRKGFWPEDKSKRNDGEMIALMHSELSECLEGLRKGNPPDEHCPAYSSAEVKLADLIIRVMDMAQGRRWDLGNAILAKMAYNEGRPHKHGKEF